MANAHTNRPQGPPYRAELKRLLTKEPWAAGINTTTTAHCYWLIDNLPAVTAWREGIGDKRDVWNHPSTVKRNYEAHLTRLAQASAVKAKAAADATQPPMRQDDPVDIVRMLRSGVFKPGTAMTEVADVLEAGLAYDTLKRLHAELGRRLDNHERQDRIEADVRKGKRA